MNLSEYKNAVAALGCIAHDCNAPANLHHPRFSCGLSQRAPDWLVIPLCSEHHQGGYSIHMTPDLFAKIEGTEQELLARTIKNVVAGL